MDNRPWLDRLREELSRRRLPRAYAERLVEELSDHFQDLTEETMHTEAVVARLGEPEIVAETAVRCRPSFFRRHRWLRMTTFVILPVPLLVLSWALIMAALVMTGEALGADEGMRELAHGWTRFQDIIAHLFFSATVTVPATLLAGGYCLLARRSGSRQRWGIAAGVLVAAFAGLVTHQLTFSDVPGKGSIAFGVGFPPKIGVWQLVQFALPLAVVCLASGWRRATRRPQLVR